MPQRHHPPPPFAPIRSVPGSAQAKPAAPRAVPPPPVAPAQPRPTGVQAKVAPGRSVPPPPLAPLRGAMPAIQAKAAGTGRSVEPPPFAPLRGQAPPAQMKGGSAIPPPPLPGAGRAAQTKAVLIPGSSPSAGQHGNLVDCHRNPPIPASSQSPTARGQRVVFAQKAERQAHNLSDYRRCRTHIVQLMHDPSNPDTGGLPIEIWGHISSFLGLKDREAGLGSTNKLIRTQTTLVTNENAEQVMGNEYSREKYEKIGNAWGFDFIRKMKKKSLEETKKEIKEIISSMWDWMRGEIHFGHVESEKLNKFIELRNHLAQALEGFVEDSNFYWERILHYLLMEKENPAEQEYTPVHYFFMEHYK